MYQIRKDFDLNKLNPGNLEISTLEITFKVWAEKGKQGVLVKISGKYGHGSDGANDAKYISWRLREVFDHPEYSFKGAVIDLTDFEYEWGDDIDVDPPVRDIPFLVVLKKDHAELYTYFISKQKIRHHLRTALSEVNDQIKKI